MGRVSSKTREWWVMGTPVPGGGRYLAWWSTPSWTEKSHYIETPDPEAAVAFRSKADAMREIASPLVLNDLDWPHGGIVPLLVTKSVAVEEPEGPAG